jgi:hypothetical protein
VDYNTYRHVPFVFDLQMWPTPATSTSRAIIVIHHSIRLIHRLKDGRLKFTRYLVENELSHYPYAILSHTWLINNEDAVTYQDFVLAHKGKQAIGLREGIVLCKKSSCRWPGVFVG